MRVEGCFRSQGPGSEASLTPKSGVSKCKHNLHSHPGLVGSFEVEVWKKPNKEVGGWTSCAATTALSITQMAPTIAASFADDPGRSSHVIWSRTGRLLREAPIPQPVNTTPPQRPQA